MYFLGDTRDLSHLLRHYYYIWDHRPYDLDIYGDDWQKGLGSNLMMCVYLKTILKEILCSKGSIKCVYRSIILRKPRRRVAEDLKCCNHHWKTWVQLPCDHSSKATISYCWRNACQPTPIQSQFPQIMSTNTFNQSNLAPVCLPTTICQCWPWYT